MGRFILRRLLQGILVVVVTAFLIFIATFSLGDPFASTGEKVVPPEVAAINRAKFGLDQPLPVQFVNYLGNMVTGDFGLDFDQRRPVSQLLAETVPNTILLAVVALLFLVLFGVTAGVIAAVRRYSFWDVFVTVVSTIGIGVPVFVVAIFLVANVSGVGPFPPVPRSFLEEVPWYWDVILPAFTLAIIESAFVARLMRGSMLEVLQADYIRTARAKGLSERTVIGKHAMRTSLLPVVTFVGLTLGTYIGGAIVTETVFQYNGAGFLLARAITNNNAPVIMAVVVYSVVAYVLLSMLVDILYAYLDPRIRLS
ncbi:Dipeptide transport system permease protein DppB [Pseudonocardia sp. Ae406_Ps2]|uniref:ABC transporter permease n=1 Tax=unclassified Pseudonocardia TaxID=2619320 RepID=UPI000319614F|nr:MULTISPECIES: ABC transporter permease [unclassified Pseudonocardia]OLL99465.1 Dipeptide transport system permease protein DppB [Pseudonocardia sp. Ae331_Ps2]OLM02793.1 Dipeptide transport system permease protein DppB [Pseudonocardia sp. Ae406_Ps2]OLM12372.1 Oligopeptide transport system permease protein OppB [Pseudonocardia sp. Ae505_Ps2]OLM24372.1 Dipeptide transport system permease protein DppB [Pseudonocardia sp. Ae706_Ps2]OLM29700.1 Oligopeptide transport system permease protein OppB [